MQKMYYCFLSFRWIFLNNYNSSENVGLDPKARQRDQADKYKRQESENQAGKQRKANLSRQAAGRKVGRRSRWRVTGRQRKWLDRLVKNR